METPSADSGVSSTGAEGIESNNLREEGSVATINDPNDDIEFAEYMEGSSIKPGTPAWELERRAFNQTSVLELGSVIDTLYPEEHAPVWADPDEFHESRFPCNSIWKSLTLNMLLRRERGKRFDGTMTMARLGLQLRMGVTSNEPYLMASKSCVDPDTNDFVEYHLSQLTIGEAVELAHLLLLMVDVATDTPDEIAGVA
ncbi:hypothetical protein [Rhodococcus sp. IEGM 1330]|uniref:hypothetical protein n=1 Tax=Rhodococcus sp. IEGM 1330 TaxID=3082225 RepID=UPI0029539663|nr:hypothetical protein [Rhodococcus sp. IEGM 1330]MDV8021999.1 hypothetical protein [Rhodococcus sp. IEGM 1330]